MSAVHAHPSGHVGGRWLPPRRETGLECRNPSRWSEVLGRVSFCSARGLAAACDAAHRALPAWEALGRHTRAGLLRAWAGAIARRQAECAALLATEIGKPVADARAEVRRASLLVRAAAELSGRLAEETGIAPGVRARGRALGTVALVTPWNNPMGIPAGKIAPALLFGNALVWKPSPRAPGAAILLMETLVEAGLPPGVVNLVFGDAATARGLLESNRIAAVSLTGSSGTGLRVAALCARHLKPLQAELGGNNASIVTGDCDLDRAASELAAAAFSFAGQRCTAPRRLIVERSVLRRFRDRLAEAVAALRVGDPHEEATQVGPLISDAKLRATAASVRAAVRRGAALLAGGSRAPGLEAGCWLQPALLEVGDPGDPLVCEESFAPVAVIQPARDLAHAIKLCNAVPQGLVASLYSSDAASRARFLAEARAGVLKIDQPTLDVHPLAPFGGWKASGLGPPEHGPWDEWFYTRPQAVYEVAAPLVFP